METWIFRGGRWKIISEKWLIAGMLLGSSAAGITGFFAGIRVTEWRYEARIDALHSEYDMQIKDAEERIRRLRQDVDLLLKQFPAAAIHQDLS